MFFTLAAAMRRQKKILKKKDHGMSACHVAQFNVVGTRMAAAGRFYQQVLVLAFICVASGMKLVYFDAKGVVELARVMLKVGNVAFEDVRYAIISKEGGGGFDTPEFTIAKANGELAINMDRAPMLVVGDTKIGQSKTIERYVANKCGLMGSNSEEAAVIDCIAENIRDIKEKWSKIRSIGGMGPNAEKDLAMKKWFEEGEFKEWLSKLEKSLPPPKVDTFAVGSSLSYADMTIWYVHARG